MTELMGSLASEGTGGEFGDLVLRREGPDGLYVVRADPRILVSPVVLDEIRDGRWDQRVATFRYGVPFGLFEWGPGPDGHPVHVPARWPTTIRIDAVNQTVVYRITGIWQPRTSLWAYIAEWPD